MKLQLCLELVFWFCICWCGGLQCYENQCFSEWGNPLIWIAFDYNMFVKDIDVFLGNGDLNLKPLMGLVCAEAEGFTSFQDWWDWNLISDDSDDEMDGRQRRRVAKRKSKPGVRRGAKSRIPMKGPVKLELFSSTVKTAVQ